MQELKIFKYNNNSIEFEIINGQVFANATAMCQAFGRKPVKWLELESTKRYVSALKAKSDFRTLVETRQGGLNPGTWIHEKLILKLAQWLDINFELWCDEKVSELIRTGKVELKPKTQAELFLESAQMLVAQEQRLSVVETKLLQIEESRNIATQELLIAERSIEEVPEETIRAKIRKLVNQYSFAKNTDQQSVWHVIYDRLYYRYGISLRAIVKKKGENSLDVAERLGYLEKIFAICSKELV